MEQYYLWTGIGAIVLFIIGILTKTKFNGTLSKKGFGFGGSDTKTKIKITDVKNIPNGNIVGGSRGGESKDTGEIEIEIDNVYDAENIKITGKDDLTNTNK